MPAPAASNMEVQVRLIPLPPRAPARKPRLLPATFVITFVATDRASSQHWRTDYAGRLMSEPTAQFFDKRARDAFSLAVIQALKRRHPRVFDDAGAAP
jgi:hypothetical protein